MADEANSRKFPRIRTRQVISLREATPEESPDGDALKADIANISKGGVFIATDKPFPIDTVVAFDMRLPTLPQNIPVKAVVRWSQGEKEPRGMGVEFIEISENELNALNVYLDAYISES